MVSRSRNDVVARLDLSPEQRQRLVVRLFSASQGNIAGQASLRGAMAGLLRRGVLGA
jgi:cellulose synthase (UDP-forming)